MKLSSSRFVFLILTLIISFSAKAQYPLTETGITITFDNFDADTAPLVAAPSASQLDSDSWAVDLDNDNDFDMDGAGGFGDAYSDGENFTANEEGDQWDDYDSEDIIHSYNFDLDGLNATAPSIGMGVTANFATNVDALITKIQNTGTLDITDLELELDAYYYYEVASSSIADGTIGIYYFVSSTNITNDLSSATWTELTTLSNEGEYADGWKEFTTNTYSINGVSLNVNDYLYLKFTFDPNSPPQYGNDQALAIDNIAINPVGFVGTDATTTLVIDESASSTTVNPNSSSTEIFRFNIVDDGASDGYATTFSEFTIGAGSNNAISDWTDLFETITLTDETGGGSTTATIGTNILTFSGFTYASATDIGYVADGTSKTYSLTIDFVDTYTGNQNIDNDLLQFLVEASNIEIEGVSSTFQTANQIQTSSSNNLLDVTASALQLQDEPAVVGTGSTPDVYFGLSIRTMDAAGHLDEDVSSSFTITEATETLNSGSLTFTSGSATVSFSAGVYTFSDLYFDTSGNYTISFASGAGYTGANFAITAATSWRTAANGDWGNSTGTVWEYFVDGVGWNTASTNEHPNATLANVGPVFIYHTIAIETTGYDSDQMNIESGGVLDVNNAFTIIDDGTSEYDLIIEDGGLLDVEADITINGTFLVKEGSSVSDFGGVVQSNSEAYIRNMGSSVNGYWESYSALILTGNVQIDLSGGDVDFFPNATSTQYPIFENGGRQNSFSTGTNLLTVNGIWYSSVGTSTLNGGNFEIRNGIVADGTLVATNLSTFSGDTIFLSGDIGRYNDLDFTFSSSAPTVVQLLGDVSVSNNNLGYLFQSSSTLVLGDYSLDADDLSTSSLSTIKVSNSSGFGANQFANVNNLSILNGTIFHFNGSSAQTTGFGTLDGGTTTIDQLVVDNDAGLTLDSDITLTGTLAFEEGIFNTQPTSPGILSVSSTASFTGFSSSSHIQGPISIGSFASSKFIPIGDNDAGTDYYRPLILDPDASMAITAEYTRSDPTAISSTYDTDGTDNPQAITTSGYYTIEFGATGTVDIGLYFDAAQDAITGSSDLIVAKYDDSANEWVGYPSSTFGADYILATVTIDDLADTYFTVASVTGSLLPVELLSFTAAYQKSEVVLNWTTASELNNERFEIEHSRNGIDFSKIGQIAGAGTVNSKQDYQFIHINPLSPTNYYKLKQVDYDGTFAYSRMITVASELFDDALQIVENPVKNQSLRFNYRGSSEVSIRIFSLSGNEFKNNKITSSSEGFQVDTAHLPPGMYLLFVNGDVERFVIY